MYGPYALCAEGELNNVAIGVWSVENGETYGVRYLIEVKSLRRDK